MVIILRTKVVLFKKLYFGRTRTVQLYTIFINRVLYVSVIFYSNIKKKYREPNGLTRPTKYYNDILLIYYSLQCFLS